MKKVFFVQVGFEFDGSVYLPYAAGTILAYCAQDPLIRKTYTFSEIYFDRRDPRLILREAADPYIFAFSCSVWNMEYNKTLAKGIKEKYPDCQIIFGGHSVSEDAQLLSEEPYVDILMFGEGEQTFRHLLCALAQKRSLADVPNIAFRKDGETVCTQREYYDDLSAYPSAYLSGIFDDILRKNPQRDFLAVLETNRGCPYSCAYCDWCAGRKVRFFPLERVYAEIEWLAKHKIEYCFCADSNFGMFARDYDIACALISAKRKYGYPKVFRPCYEKNSDERVFRICSALNSEGMDKGATMAYQTLNPEALRNIGRKNLTMEHFSTLMQKYNEAGIPTYSELILGLPGETKESFCEGICRLLENGQHNSLSVYHCEVLPNSDLADPAFLRRHRIEVIRVAFNHIHSAVKKDEHVQEYSYLVRSTATMPREDWVYANLFSVCVQCFHSLGILRCFALYLHAQGKTTYMDFYTGLLEFILRGNGRLHKLWMQFKEKYDRSLSGDWNYYNAAFGNVTWFFEEGAFLEMQRQPDAYYEELLPFLARFPMDAQLSAQLMQYQRAVLRKPAPREETVTFDWDFREFFDAVLKGKKACLQKRKTVLQFSPKMQFSTVAEYAKQVVWFGRRRGASMLSADEVKQIKGESI